MRSGPFTISMYWIDLGRRIYPLKHVETPRASGDRPGLSPRQWPAQGARNGSISSWAADGDGLDGCGSKLGYPKKRGCLLFGDNIQMYNIPFFWYPKCCYCLKKCSPNSMARPEKHPKATEPYSIIRASHINGYQWQSLWTSCDDSEMGRPMSSCVDHWPAKCFWNVWLCLTQIHRRGVITIGAWFS